MAFCTQQDTSIWSKVSQSVQECRDRVADHCNILFYSFTAPQDADDSEFRKLYITVTAMPSLNNCKDCISIKRSLQQDGK